ncbi:hypothetical protein DASC09_034750 [Saccharomycopsis crataegensis]|uniref:LicD/FKTN/FKRP nucleotidyltransferase domain-containing protein n=1 Tax=Saccharomycopsis crataegensis TaxID=43959 RepID=A0AAV5QNL7_9ASCO|nr:hypothetical protein DASC09_034750 [Saccharomycopsis crataegensis]
MISSLTHRSCKYNLNLDEQKQERTAGIRGSGSFNSRQDGYHKNKATSFAKRLLSSLLKYRIMVPGIIIIISMALTWFSRELAIELVTGKSKMEKQYSLNEFSNEIRQALQTIHFPNKIIEHFNPDWTIGSSEDGWNDESIGPSVLMSVSKVFDMRLAPALSLALFRQSLEKSHFDYDYKAPFSWYSWLDLDNRLTYENYFEETFNFSTCETFKDYYKLSFRLPCTNIESRHGKSIAFLSPIQEAFPVSARRIIAASYLAHSAPLPQRLLFLNVGDSHESLSLPTIPCQNMRNCLLDMGLNYINQESNFCENSCNVTVNKGLNFRDQIKSYLTLLDQLRLEFGNSGRFHSSYDQARLINDSKTHLYNTALTKANFIVELPILEKEALQKVGENMLSKLYDRNVDFDYRFLQMISSMDRVNPPKYFYEALLTSKTHEGGHYDWRFFNRAIYDDRERNLILHRITKAWLTFAKQVGLKTWLMHGTLLGFHFNGMNMPFDNDLDVVMTMDSLLKLGREYNQTLIIDTSIKHNMNESLGIGSYLLDINPSYLLRSKGNGQNTIDARLIDTYTGLYIDITAIASTLDHKFNKRSLKHFQQEFNQMLDPNYEERIISMDTENYGRSLDDKLKQLINYKHVYNCKNNHFYQFSDIEPLRQVYFEGLEAYIPNGIERILNREYNKALRKFRYKNYIFRKQLRLWISIEDCPAKISDPECLKNLKVEREFNLTKDFTQLHQQSYRPFHGKNNENLSSSIFKDDPWLLELAEIIHSTIKEVKNWR